MIALPNGCSASELKVYPENWKTKEASTKKSWYVFYRFYDPTARDKYPNGKLVRLKGFNRVTDLKDRQTIARSLLENELKLLKERGYNPISRQFMLEDEPEEISYLVPPTTPFVTALEKAKESLTLAKSTKADISSVLKYVKTASATLRYNQISISAIETKHIKSLLEYLMKTNERYTANRYNKARAYLMMLFKELKEQQAIKHNPVIDISKKKTTKKLQAVLSDEERKKINDYLKGNHYSFWRFMHLYYCSGTRITELLSLQGKVVDLKRQRFKVLIMKGKEYREVWKTIRNIALPLWQEIMDTCKPDDFLFSIGLQPGNQKIRTEQITRRWRVHVKVKLGIEADFRTLRHLNTTEMLDHFDEMDVAKLNGHTTTTMVKTVYDVRREERQHERLKKVRNAFV